MPAIVITIYRDSVHVELMEYGAKTPIGWFRDEVEGVAAACERLMLCSALLPELRHLPNLEITTEWRTTPSGHRSRRFRRGTRVREGRAGRKVVKLPAASYKGWLPSEWGGGGGGSLSRPWA